MNEDAIRDQVRERYAAAARAAQRENGRSGCCSGPPAGGSDPITRDLYDAQQVGQVPRGALTASLGCGNPTALAQLHPGEVVLDLGSGGGIDVLLSARRVGPTGKAFGLDMTPEMHALAREHQARAGVTNAEFLLGTIEHIPLPDASVDVIVSNCVINLAPDKDAVLREAFRVLRPGGRFAVADIVLRRPLPSALQASVAMWTGCISGALAEQDYRARLARAGFTDIGVEPVRVYDRAAAEELLGLVRSGEGGGCCGSGCGGATPTGDAALLDAVDGAVMSAFVRARKPAVHG